MRGALTRSLTAAVVGKVVNMTVSRTNAVPTWSTWLDDWTRRDGARVEVKQMQIMPEERLLEKPDGKL